MKAALAAYATARVTFLSLTEAQGNVVGLQDRYYEALADHFRRRATLERFVGGPLIPQSPTREPDGHPPSGAPRH